MRNRSSSHRATAEQAVNKRAIKTLCAAYISLSLSRRANGRPNSHGCTTPRRKGKERKQTIIDSKGTHTPRTVKSIGYDRKNKNTEQWDCFVLRWWQRSIKVRRRQSMHHSRRQAGAPPPPPPPSCPESPTANAARTRRMGRSPRHYKRFYLRHYLTLPGQVIPLSV